MKNMIDCYSEWGGILVFGGMILWVFHILDWFI